MSDFIGDELTKIRNAVAVRKDTVTVLTNKVIKGVLQVLLDNGFISNFKTYEDAETNVSKAEVELKYNPTPAIVELKRASKLGQRKYVTVSEMPKVYNNLGIAILSTSKGIMSNKEAVRQNVGGEVICTVF